MVIYLLTVDFQMRLSRKNAPFLQKAQSALAAATLTFVQGIKVTKTFSVKEGNVQLNEAIKDSEEANISLTNKSMPSQFLSRLVIAIFEMFLRQ